MSLQCHFNEHHHADTRIYAGPPSIVTCYPCGRKQAPVKSPTSTYITASPSVASTNPVSALADGTVIDTLFNAYTATATATGVNRPSFMFRLNATYSDIIGINIWPRHNAVPAQAFRLRVSVCTSNSTNCVVCAASATPSPYIMSFIYCPPVSGVEYVKVEGPAATALALSEVQILRTGK